MKFKFPKTLLLASVVSLGIASFTACGDSNSDPVSGPTGISSSSAQIPEVPQNTETTAIKFDNIQMSSQTTTKVKFSGSIYLDLSDSNTVVDINAIHFTKIDFTLHSATAAMPIKMITPPMYETGTVTAVNLLEVGLTAEPTECGEMTLVFSAFATDGIKESVTSDSIKFVRDQNFCVANEPSSSSMAQPAVQLTSYEVTLKTNGQRGFMLATGALVDDPLAADVVINKNPVTVTGNNGIRFAEDYSDEWFATNLPNPATVSSFKYKNGELASTITNFWETRGSLFFVAIAPEFNAASGSAAGFYAFTVTNSTTPDPNGDVEVTLVVYKAP